MLLLQLWHFVAFTGSTRHWMQYDKMHIHFANCLWGKPFKPWSKSSRAPSWTWWSLRSSQYRGSMPKALFQITWTLSMKRVCSMYTRWSANAAMLEHGDTVLLEQTLLVTTTIAKCHILDKTRLKIHIKFTCKCLLSKRNLLHFASHGAGTVVHPKQNNLELTFRVLDM